MYNLNIILFVCLSFFHGNESSASIGRFSFINVNNTVEREGSVIEDTLKQMIMMMMMMTVTIY